MKWVYIYYLFKVFSSVNFQRGIFIIFLLEKGFSNQQISILQMIFYTLNSFAGIPCGILSDKFGHKYALIFALFMLIINSIIQVYYNEFIIFTIVFALQGASFAILHASSQSFVFEKLSQLQRTSEHIKILGNIRAISSISLGISISIGGFLQKISWGAVYFCYASCILISIFFILMIKNIKITKKENSQINLKSTTSETFEFIFNKKNFPFFMLVIAFSLLHAVLTPYFIFAQSLFHFYGMSKFQIATLFSVVELSSGLIAIFAEKISKRYSFYKIYFLSLIILFCAMISNKIQSLNLALITFVICIIVPEIIILLFDDSIQKYVPNKIRATATSIVYFIESIFISIGYFYLGLMFDKMKPNVAIANHSIIVIFSIIIVYLFYKLRNTYSKKIIQE